MSEYITQMDRRMLRKRAHAWNAESRTRKRHGWAVFDSDRAVAARDSIAWQGQASALPARLRAIFALIGQANRHTWGAPKRITP